MSDNSKSAEEILGFQISDDFWRERTPEEKKARKSEGARYGHVKRRINSGTPLTGELLLLALGVLPIPDSSIKDDAFFRDMARKLEAGEPLNDYERHLMVDMFLLRF